MWIIHAYPIGGEDLRIYRYFGHRAVAGLDPYTAPANGPVPGVYGDNQPLELLLFGGLLKIHDSAVTLRVFFAVIEAGIVALVGSAFTDRSLGWRVSVMTFLAFSPFILLAWTANGEDKSISILLLALTIVFVRRGRLGWAWAAAAVLFMLKFEGLFIVLPLLIATWKRYGRWPTVGAVCAFAAAAIPAEAPYFPHSLVAYQRRSARIDYTPGHSSWTILLNRIGLYDHTMIRPLLVAALLGVAVAYHKNWIRLDQAVALSFFFAFFFLPDQSIDRIAVILVPLVLTMSISRVGLVMIWIASLVSAVAFAAVELPLIPLNQLPVLGLTDRTIPQGVQHIVGTYASVPFVLLTNLVLVAIMLFYALDLWRRLARRRSFAEGPRTPAAT